MTCHSWRETLAYYILPIACCACCGCLLACCDCLLALLPSLFACCLCLQSLLETQVESSAELCSCNRGIQHCIPVHAVGFHRLAKGGVGCDEPSKSPHGGIHPPQSGRRQASGMPRAHSARRVRARTRRDARQRRGRSAPQQRLRARGACLRRSPPASQASAEPTRQRRASTDLHKRTVRSRDSAEQVPLRCSATVCSAPLSSARSFNAERALAELYLLSSTC